MSSRSRLLRYSIAHVVSCGIVMISLVIDQIYDSDYAHLAPEHDDLFSDVEEGGEEGDQDDDEEEVLSRDEYQESTHYAPEDMINGNGRTRKVGACALRDVT